MTLESSVKRRLKTIKDRVEWILENYPETRNDDFYLYIIYVREFEPELSKHIDYIPYNLIKKAPRFETIRRMRQKLQEAGLYPPTDPEVMKKRKRLARIYQKVMPQL